MNDYPEGERNPCLKKEAERAAASRSASAEQPSNEYEPNDSRNVTGVADTPDGRWSGDKEHGQGSGEYEPADSRNVTGTASTEDGRWTNDDKKLAPGDN